jgi:hypothetical protein
LVDILYNKLDRIRTYKLLKGVEQFPSHYLDHEDFIVKRAMSSYKPTIKQARVILKINEQFQPGGIYADPDEDELLSKRDDIRIRQENLKSQLWRYRQVVDDIENEISSLDMQILQIDG